MTVGAVTLNYKTPRDTEDTVRGILASAGVDIFVVLVENGSGEGSWEHLTARFGAEPRVELIRSEVNLGFAGGNNLGIRRALEKGASFVFLVSSDVLLEADCAARLVAVAEQTGAASAQPLMLRRGSDAVDTLGHTILPDGMVVDIGEGKPLPAGVAGADFEIFSVCAGAAMYRADALRNIGLLPDDFFIYYEDVDIGFRIRLTGGKAILVASATARHTRHGSAGGFALKHYYAERNLVAVRLRHAPLGKILSRNTALHLRLGFYEAATHNRVREFLVHQLRALVSPRVGSAKRRAELFDLWTGVERVPLQGDGS